MRCHISHWNISLKHKINPSRSNPGRRGKILLENKTFELSQKSVNIRFSVKCYFNVILMLF